MFNLTITRNATPSGEIQVAFNNNAGTPVSVLLRETDLVTIDRSVDSQVAQLAMQVYVGQGKPVPDHQILNVISTPLSTET